MDEKIEVFICYAHKDEKLMRELERQMSVLEQQGLITIWHDRMIAGGADWKQEMNKHLNAARIILLLVSSDFMSSEHCGHEVKRAMERYKGEKVKVIPVILRPAIWKGSAFGQLEALPKDGKPITSSVWHSHDEALIDVVESVQKVAEDMRSSVAPNLVQSSSDVVHSSSSSEQVLTRDAAGREFDVFLCHNNKDKPAVKKIGGELRARGVKPWLDEWELRPGLPWQRALEAQIARIKSAAVFVGNDGVGPWQNMELDAFLSEFVRRGCPVIPVLLADAPEKPQLPLFLRNMTWVDFRKQEPDPIKQLIWGITSKQPDADDSNDSSSTSSSVHLPSSSKGNALSFAKKAELINILLVCACIRNRDSRETVLGLLNEQFVGIVNAIARRTDNQTDVMEIVSTCSNHPGSLRVLIDIVTFFEGETSVNTQRLNAFMQSNAL